MRRFLSSRAAPLTLFALFALLIVLTITRFSNWGDESMTLELVRANGYRQLTYYVHWDAHPPFYYYVLKPWVSLFGETILVARAQSAVFMLAAFGVWYHFVRTRFSRGLALFSLVLMCSNPLLLTHAVDARMYALGCFLTALTSLLVTSDHKRRWLAYWPLAVAMLYTHYFLWPVVAAQFLYLLITRREQNLSAGAIIALGASIVVAFAPWAPITAHMGGSVMTGGFWVPSVTAASPFDYLERTYLHRIDAQMAGARVFPIWAFAAAWVASMIRAARAQGGPYVLLWLLAAVPSLSLLVLSFRPASSFFFPRYLVFTLPAILTLLAAGAMNLTGWWRKIAISILLIGHVLGVVELRARGLADSPGWNTMKTIAHEVSAPIDGELPEIVAGGFGLFFDAHAVLAPRQTVVELREKKPGSHRFPDVMYRTRRDWYVLSFSEITAHHVWVILPLDWSPPAPPANWKLQLSHHRGSANTYLYEVRQ